jgi:hypothetical protein
VGLCRVLDILATTKPKTPPPTTATIFLLLFLDFVGGVSGTNVIGPNGSGSGLGPAMP